MRLKASKQIARKVPEITAFFWAVKLLSTALGESTSDFLVYKINPYVAVTLGAVGLAIALTIQFKTEKYVVWKYWLAVIMVAIFGTMAADVLHIQFGVPYLISSILFAAALAVIFYVWRRSEWTLSIHTITTKRREVFYWLTVMATFALGTATGDMTASTLKLGYFSSGLLFIVLFIVPFILHQRYKMNEVLTFWWAYIITRPLGASYADWFGKDPRVGGIGMGDGTVSFILTVLIVFALVYMSVNRKEIRRERRRPVYLNDKSN